MPRIKTTRTVTVALLLLRLYLIAMLVLILVKFVLDARHGAAQPPPGTQSSTEPAGLYRTDQEPRYEIPNTKSQTNSKYEIPMSQTSTACRPAPQGKGVLRSLALLSFVSW
jgi:hypothetical protein